MNHSNSTHFYQSILNYLDMIVRKPKRDVKFFFLEEPHKFIVDGSKVRYLPIPYYRYYTRHEFYIRANVKDKIVSFYAFDRKSLTDSTRLNEASGIIPWDNALEESLYNFFLTHIRDLSSEPYSYSSPKSNKYELQSQTNYTNPTAPASNPSYNPTFSSGEDYKERERILDKMRVFQRDNKSAQAIEYIDEHIGSLLERRKFSIVDDIMRIVFPDKLPIPVAIEFLRLTKGLTELKERPFFLSKIKEHIIKANPRRAYMALNSIGESKCQASN